MYSDKILEKYKKKLVLKTSNFVRLYKTVKMMRIGFLMLLVSMVFAGCVNLDSGLNEQTLFEYSSFDDGDEGWIAAFADYPVGLEDSMRLDSGPGIIYVSESIGNVSAFKQRGYATNSDLFMYIKQQISGLEPNSRYTVYINVELISQLLMEYNGDLDNKNFGSFLKVGAFQVEPDTLEIPHATNLDISNVAVDFDKGENETGGIDMTFIGRLEYSKPGKNPIVLNGSNADFPIYTASDNEGKLWIAVGVDTNIPVYQEISYTYIYAEFRYEGAL
jgi:hypothetical protein